MPGARVHQPPPAPALRPRPRAGRGVKTPQVAFTCWPPNSHRACLTQAAELPPRHGGGVPVPVPGSRRERQTTPSSRSRCCSLRRGRGPRLASRGWQAHLGSGLGQPDLLFGHRERLHTLRSVISLFSGNNPKRTSRETVFTSETFTTATDVEQPHTHQHHRGLWGAGSGQRP